MPGLFTWRFPILTPYRAQLAAWVRIIAPFIWGLALAYLLDGPERFFEKKVHCRRGLSIALTCVTDGACGCVLIRMVVPQVVDSLMILINRVPGYMENLNRAIQEADLSLNGVEDLIGSYQQLAYTRHRACQRHAAQGGGLWRGH